jgi:hypothetical protein
MERSKAASRLSIDWRRAVPVLSSRSSAAEAWPGALSAPSTGEERVGDATRGLAARTRGGERACITTSCEACSRPSTARSGGTKRDDPDAAAPSVGICEGPARSADGGRGADDGPSLRARLSPLPLEPAASGSSRNWSKLRLYAPEDGPGVEPEPAPAPGLAREYALMDGGQGAGQRMVQYPGPHSDQHDQRLWKPSTS